MQRRNLTNNKYTDRQQPSTNKKTITFVSGTSSSSTTTTTKSSSSQISNTGNRVIKPLQKRVIPNNTPSRTLNKLGNQYVTHTQHENKSAAIAREMQMLSDEYFGQVQQTAPQEHNTSTSTSTRKALCNPISNKVSSSIVSNNSTNFATNNNELCKSSTYYTQSALPSSWLHDGPREPKGQLFDASDSNLLCMDVLIPCTPKLDVQHNINKTVIDRNMGVGVQRKTNMCYRRSDQQPLCVVGSADHGLRVFSLNTMRQVKNLYNKSFGHTEWVTTCKFLPNGQVISGGMDSKLCLWDNVRSGGPARCRDLLAHTGSISQVQVNDTGSVAVSASYDRTLRVWSLSTGRVIGCLAGHQGPVMQFTWSGNCVLSGDRQGNIKLWDVSTAMCTASMKTTKGQVGALQQLVHDELGHIVMYGDQGGVLTVVDTRCSSKPTLQKTLHAPGVLSGIRIVNEQPYIVTCGADRRICVLDPRQEYHVLHTFTDHVDIIYSLETLGPLILSGASNGWLLVHDAVHGGKCCYGLQPHASAVREIFASPNLLVTAGDDGKACTFQFE